MGFLLGWMSTRVLGQYDLLIIEDERPEEQDLVYYVGPNIVGLERRFAFPPEEFRLWIALHECTHRAQFTGVPWLRPHFLGLVDQLLGTVDPDPGRLLDGLRRAPGRGARRRPPARPGRRWPRAVATPEQRQVLDQIGGLMSLLEGHGDVTMNRAGDGLVPSAERFERVLRARRQSGAVAGRFLQRLVGPRGQAGPVRAGRAVHRGRRGGRGRRAVRPGVAGARRGCPRWRRSGSRTRGSSGSAPPHVAGRQPTAGRWTADGVRPALLARCAFPPAGHAR